MAPPRGKYQVKLNAVMFSMMLEDLLAGPCTAQDIATHTGMNILTVQRTFRQMYARKVVHISGWEQDTQGRWVIRVFSLGAGIDKKRPPKKTEAQRRKEWRERSAARELGGAMYAGLVAANDSRRAA